jgi:hypothetical protein
MGASRTLVAPLRPAIAGVGRQTQPPPQSSTRRSDHAKQSQQSRPQQARSLHHGPLYMEKNNGHRGMSGEEIVVNMGTARNNHDHQPSTAHHTQQQNTAEHTVERSHIDDINTTKKPQHSTAQRSIPCYTHTSRYTRFTTYTACPTPTPHPPPPTPPQQPPRTTHQLRDRRTALPLAPGPRPCCRGAG